MWTASSWAARSSFRSSRVFGALGQPCWTRRTSTPRRRPIASPLWRRLEPDHLGQSPLDMQITELPFGITEWAAIEPTEHAGESGVAYWRTREFGPIRVRMVEYSAGYRANHWCE